MYIRKAELYVLSFFVLQVIAIRGYNHIFIEECILYLVCKENIQRNQYYMEG